MLIITNNLCITITVLSGEGLPTAEITSPPSSISVSTGTPIRFEAIAEDPEDAVLSGSTLQRYSDVDGFIGTGSEFEYILTGPITPCDPKFVEHKIALLITDSDGNNYYPPYFCKSWHFVLK